MANNGDLTAREEQILQLIAEDLTTREIAARLVITTKTVEFHKTRIKKRLGVNGIAGMVRYAIRIGLLAP